MSNDTLPPPPAYYKEFARGPDAMQPPSIDQVKNTNSSYTFFAEELRFDFEEPPLGSFGVDELYDAGDIYSMPKEKYAELLKKLIRSLNKSTEQLMKFLRENPSNAMEKMQDIRSLCNNLFYLLNFLRKRQAFVYLEKKMEHSIAERDATREELRTRMKVFQEKLQALTE